MLTISEVKSDIEILAVQSLIQEFTTWAISLLNGSENAPTFNKLEEELATLPGIYAPPSGHLLLALQDEQPAGCVALLAHSRYTCEMKRFYVRPTFRGHGIGWELLKVLFDLARQDGYKRMVLDSHHSMKKAHELYRAVGFQEVNAPANFPEDLKPFVVFMECDLIESS
ncbi:MAG: GNAT family N-acetyltransferase [Anaerolineae bacterium]|nr:GNAT family N-acetyltransferase [Anaerolineae bacterium]